MKGSLIFRVILKEWKTIYFHEQKSYVPAGDPLDTHANEDLSILPA
jgi:hypothetical protein